MDEVTTTGQQNILLTNQDILKLISKVIDNTSEERTLALNMYNHLTKGDSFTKLADIMYKTDAVARMLELANRSTGELNKLLATIQRFSSDKVQSENVDKLMSVNEITGILNALDVLKVGPDKFTGNTIKQEIVDSIKEVQKNYKDKNGADVEFVDMDDINE